LAELRAADKDPALAFEQKFIPNKGQLASKGKKGKRKEIGAINPFGRNIKTKEVMPPKVTLV